MSILLTGVGKGAAVNLAPGYYILKTAVAPTNPAPNSPLWVTTTAKLSDVGADDETTEEAVSVAGLNTVGTIEVLFVPAAPGTWATDRVTVRYATAGPSMVKKYWDGAAWQAWDTLVTTPHLSDDFETYPSNPTDQAAPYLLLEMTGLGDGSAVDFAVSDWRPSA